MRKDALTTLIVIGLVGSGATVFLYFRKYPVGSIANNRITAPPSELPFAAASDRIHAAGDGSVAVPTAGWRTYRNRRVGFELKYPPYFEADELADSVEFHSILSSAERQELRRGGIPRRAVAVLHFYRLMPAEDPKVQLQRAIRRRIGDDPFLRHLGTAERGSLRIDTFRYGVIDPEGELVTVNPKTGVAVGIETGIRQISTGDERFEFFYDEVRSMYRSLGFIEP